MMISVIFAAVFFFVIFKVVDFIFHVQSAQFSVLFETLHAGQGHSSVFQVFVFFGFAQSLLPTSATADFVAINGYKIILDALFAGQLTLLSGRVNCRSVRNGSGFKYRPGKFGLLIFKVQKVA